MKEKLLPCPFCGGEANLRRDDMSVCVVCSNVDCYCAFGEAYDRDAMPDHLFRTDAQATKAWNHRVDPPLWLDALERAIAEEAHFYRLELQEGYGVVLIRGPSFTGRTIREVLEQLAKHYGI